MNSKIKNRWMLALAVSAVAIWTGSAFAQVQVQTDGHALDASNQVGSGGYNTHPAVSSVTGNQIVTGNVTGGFAFQGRNVNGVNLGPGYTDPFAFRGILPGTGVDQFNALAGGSGNGKPQPFYGRANTVAPPPGYVQNSNNTGFVPTPVNTQVAPWDTRLGSPNGQFTTSPLPQLGSDLVLPGPVDPYAYSSLYAASPLYGVRQWQNTTTGNNPFLPNAPLSPNPGQSTGPMDPTQQLQLQQSQATQNQLNNNATGTQPPPSNNGAAPLVPLTPDSGSKPLPPLQSQSTQVLPQSLSPLPGNVSTDQTNRQYIDPLTTIPAAQQSPQMAEMQRRLQQFEGSHPKTDEQANQEFHQALAARRALIGDSSASPAIPGPAVPLPAPAGNSSANNPSPDVNPALTPVTPDTNLPAPVQVDSLADNVASTTLSNLLKDGENSIQQQQYDKAIEKFDQGMDAFPDNPLILLGRAQAELAGSYYRQARADLLAAYGNNPSTLLVQYNLEKTLGTQRLEYVVSELKQIATGSSDNATAPFLLAFISYNTHHEADAAQWLAMADTRSHGSEEPIQSLKSYWKLRTGPSTKPVGSSK